MKVGLASWCLWVLLLAAAAASSSGQGTVELRFLDSETGYDLRPDRVVVTDGSGSVCETAGRSVLELKAGNYALNADVPGYRTSPIALSASALPDGPKLVRIWVDPVLPPPELAPERIRSLHGQDSMLLNGFVVDDASGNPLADVQVVCKPATTELAPNDGVVETRTNERGYFELQAPRSGFEEDGASAALSLTYSGYDSHEVHAIELWPGGDWTFRIRLLQTPRANPQSVLNRPLDGRSGYAATATSSNSTGGVRVPQNIRVLDPDGDTIHYVSLEYYCRRVLPAEWIASWAAFPGGNHALNAGAVAVRTYAVGAINKPRASNYDICGTTACQVYGPATSTYSDEAVRETAGYVLTDQSGFISPALAEYSAENNSLGLPCGDGFASPTGGCLADPVCAGESRSGHGRGLCQWGSARWATGLKFPGNSTRDRTTPNGFPRQDWVWILSHYYPDLRLVRGTPLEIGDAVLATAGLRVRACAGGTIAGGIDCPALATQPQGSVGTIVQGPVLVTADGAGYSWFQVQWEDVLGWSVENYLERVPRPLLSADVAGGEIKLSWVASLGFSYRVQSRSNLPGSSWNDVSTEITPITSACSWSAKLTDGQRFFRLRILPSNSHFR
ncbi:MAG: SpoIID/LytB domain-containing protein [Verrucomicrobiia bacterium]